MESIAPLLSEVKTFPSITQMVWGDPVATLVVTTVSFVLGAMMTVLPSFMSPPMGLIAIALTAVVPIATPVRASKNLDLTIYRDGILKSTSSLIWDRKSPRNGTLITLLHADYPAACQFINAGIVTEPNPLRFRNGTDGRIVIDPTCLNTAARLVGSQALRTPTPGQELPAKALTWFVNPYVSPMDMLVNEVAGMCDRANFCMCVGFFLGIIAVKCTVQKIQHNSPNSKPSTSWQNVECAEKYKFWGKTWMLSIIYCRVCCFFIVIWNSVQSLEGRVKRFSQTNVITVQEYLLLVFSDQIVWMGLVTLLRSLDQFPHIKTIVCFLPSWVGTLSRLGSAAVTQPAPEQQKPPLAEHSRHGRGVEKHPVGGGRGRGRSRGRSPGRRG